MSRGNFPWGQGNLGQSGPLLCSSFIGLYAQNDQHLDDEDQYESAQSDSGITE